MDHRIDAKNRPLGRVASEIARLLQGKASPDYAPNKVTSDRVLVENFDQLVVTGNKAEQKMYHRHTGYVGHVKSINFKDFFAKSPKRVLQHAVRKMLPQNFLTDRRLKRLVFVEKGDK